MTSYKFEIAAKNAVIAELKRGYGLDEIHIQDIDLVWFSHTLGNKKCCIWGAPMGDKYAEVTYSVGKKEMYVNIYKKVQLKVVPENELDCDVTTYA